MAIKFFIATCEKKVSKHPVKDGKTYTIPIKAETQADAKEAAKAKIEQIDAAFEGESETYSDWYKNPNLEKVSEEDYNAAELALIAESVKDSDIDDQLVLEDQHPNEDFPEIQSDGFYNSNDPKAETSSFIFQNDGEMMQAAKVFILKVAPNQWSFGFKYRSGSFEKHDQMNLDRVGLSREEAIDSGILRLENFLDYQDEFGNDESQSGFISAAMNYNFYDGFKTNIEQIIDALKSHPDIENAENENEDFIHVVQAHFEGFWSNAESPAPAIEHIHMMRTIGVLYNEEACLESFKQYLPIQVSPKTQQTMSRIEDALNKPAVNDPDISNRIWKAAIPINENIHVVIAIMDCTDQGWRFAYEGNSQQECIFGDAEIFSAEFTIDRKESIKKAAQHITDALYQYDTSLALAKVFMKSPYIQVFEENCIEVSNDADPDNIHDDRIRLAIQKRFDARPNATTKEGEISIAYEAISSLITDETDIDLLVVEIENTEHCNHIFMSPYVDDLVKKCTPDPVKLHPQIFSAIQARLKKADLTESDMMKAHDLIIPNVTEKTDINLLCNQIANIKNHNNLLVGTNACQLVIQCEKQDTERQNSEHNQSNKYEVFVSECLACIDDSHLDYSSEQYKVMGCNLERTINDYVGYENGQLDVESTLKNIREVDWDSGNECAKHFLNGRLLRALVSENMEVTTPSETNHKPQEVQSSKEVIDAEPEQEDLREEQNSQENRPASDESITPVTRPAVSLTVVDNEPAEPIEVVTIADLPDSYNTNPNMSLWMKGFKTDLQHVKPDQNGRLSIKTQYRLMKATEIWGAVGVGWGYKVLREWVDNGAPIIMNGAITEYFEQIHKVEIEFWYMHEGTKVSFTQYGDTRKLYMARGGYFVHDDEVEKKSLSDALGKAMSMVGICADVYLGTYDGDALLNKTEQMHLANRQLKQLEFDGQASDAAIAKAKSYTDKFKSAPSLAEIKRLEKLAITALEAYPTPDEDSQRKKQKAVSAISAQATAAIEDFNKDLQSVDKPQKEQANG
ncbi:hypothetical protein [Vibrio ziniensis]|uniref:Uncharacterized protein n=1 Tax=Vibrio ziniensis TaxID=2711221 RepID=A0A6G7CN49_9VIBR|nr:hypothetical protein [Vibrio ziniensis]QIH43476.1 hypothetical protein G5S32_15880 [Vibrio ziniensis]